MKEQPNIKPEVKKEKLPYEIELEQQADPLEGEAFDVWLERIGGPNVELLESLDKYQAPKKKGEAPLRINKNGTFMLNSENVSTYFNKEKLDAEIAKKSPNVRFVKISGEYLLKKEMFKDPELYFRVISEELRSNRKIVADKRFGKSLKKWSEELKAPGEEEPKETPKPQKTIAELEEEIERLQTAYAPLGWFHKKPVLRDLGYYANQNKIEEIKKEIEKLKTGKFTIAEAKEEKPKEKPREKSQEQVEKEGLVYRLGKKIREQKPREAFERVISKTKQGINTIDEFGERKLAEWLEKDGIIYKLGKKIREQKSKEITQKVIDKIKKGIDSIDNLGQRKKQKEPVLPEEIEEDINIINKRLQKLPSKIRTSSVLNRSILEKEQTRLQKRLKKLKKK